MKNEPTTRIYHRIKPTEKFEETATTLINLLFEEQRNNPNQKRILYLDITGHRNTLGGYDSDTYELMSEFIPKNLLMWLTEAHTPLGMWNNPYQHNDVPEEIEIS